MKWRGHPMVYSFQIEYIQPESCNNPTCSICGPPVTDRLIVFVPSQHPSDTDELLEVTRATRKNVDFLVRYIAKKADRNP